METAMSYFLGELIWDIKENPDLYKDMDILHILGIIQYYDESAGYNDFNDIEKMSGDERRNWMREYFGY